MQTLISISKKQAIFFVIFLVMYEFITYIANDMMMPVMIYVTAFFHAPDSSIADSLTAYVLGGATLQLVLGPLSDRFGRRSVMLIGAFFFFLMTILVASSHSIHQFLMYRFFEGMGLCFIVVVGYSVLQELFTEMDAIRLIALMGNVAILAPLLGPLAGALLSDYMTWRAMFLSVAGFALIAFIGLWRYMPELIGQTKINGDVIEHTPLSMKNVISNYTSLLKNKTFMFGSIALGLLALPCVVWIALSPVMLVKYAHLTPAQYALWQIPVFGGIILGNITLTRLSYHYSINRLRFMGGLIVLSSLLSMFLLPCIMGEHYIWLTPGLVLYSFGQGIAQPPLMRSVLFATHVPKGTASAMLCTCSMSVQAIGIEIANLLYGSHSNMLFGFYNAALGVLFFVLLQSLKVHISDKSAQSL